MQDLKEIFVKRVVHLETMVSSVSRNVIKTVVYHINVTGPQESVKEDVNQAGRDLDVNKFVSKTSTVKTALIHADSARTQTVTMLMARAQENVRMDIKELYAMTYVRQDCMEQIAKKNVAFSASPHVTATT